MASLRLRAGLGALLAGILITIGGCSEPSAVVNTGTGADASSQLVARQQPSGGASYNVLGAAPVEKVIGPEGGTLLIPGGHSLVFPAGAVSQPTRIRAKPDPRYVGVELEPHGIQFPVGREPLLTISFQHANVAGFSSLSVVYVEGARILEYLPTEVDFTTRTAGTRLQHFSGYLLSGGRSAN